MPLVEVNNLNFSYPDGTVALRGVRFCLEPGEKVGLVGPNGAGKSTLLWHLNGLLPQEMPKSSASSNGKSAQGDVSPEMGEVRINGHRITRDNLGEVRRTVGLVFQDPDDQLFSTTVLRDVAFGLLNMGISWEEAAQRSRQVLEQVGLVGKEHRRPHRLSQGEKKRASLAGVLACRPSLLALDEPTSNLDPRGRRQLIQILQSLEESQLIATHDLEMVLELCPRVILLDNGVVAADGSARDILGNRRLVEAHGLEVPMSLQR